MRWSVAAVLLLLGSSLILMGSSGQNSIQVSVSSTAPITDILLDNSIFTRSLAAGDTIIGQITSTPSNVPATYAVTSGADSSKFKVVTGSLCQPFNRVDPTLRSNGNVTAQNNGFSIQITATPTGGGTPFTQTFHIGAPTHPFQGASIRVTTSNAQSQINAAAAGNTILFAPGTYSGLTLKSGLVYVSGTPESTSGTRATLSGVTVGTSNITVYGFNISGAVIGVSGSNVNFINNNMFSDLAFASDNSSNSIFSWNTSDAGAFTAGGGAVGAV